MKFDEDVLEVSDIIKKIITENFASNILVSVTVENIPKCDSILIVLQKKNNELNEIGRSEIEK